MIVIERLKTEQPGTSTSTSETQRARSFKNPATLPTASQKHRAQTATTELQEQKQIKPQQIQKVTPINQVQL